jgi:hypothetical protein
MNSQTDTHLLSFGDAASRACMMISAATSSPRRPRSTQFKSECSARWRTGFIRLSRISCDAASARRGSDPARVINLSNPVVAARHSRIWHSTCVQATAREIGSALNSRANRTERQARVPGRFVIRLFALSVMTSVDAPFNSFCFAKRKSSASFPLLKPS